MTVSSSAGASNLQQQQAISPVNKQGLAKNNVMKAKNTAAFTVNISADAKAKQSVVETMKAKTEMPTAMNVAKDINQKNSAFSGGISVSANRSR